MQRSNVTEQWILAVVLTPEFARTYVCDFRGFSYPLGHHLPLGPAALFRYELWGLAPD